MHIALSDNFLWLLSFAGISFNSNYIHIYWPWMLANFSDPLLKIWNCFPNHCTPALCLFLRNPLDLQAYRGGWSKRKNIHHYAIRFKFCFNSVSWQHKRKQIYYQQNSPAQLANMAVSNSTFEKDKKFHASSDTSFIVRSYIKSLLYSKLVWTLFGGKGPRLLFNMVAGQLEKNTYNFCTTLHITFYVRIAFVNIASAIK